jgi:lipoate-protein ligase A
VARAVWRLILDGPVEGAMNMALDRTVLHGVAAGDAPPTLRLYRWEVPTVTLGRFQRLEQVDADACARRGFDLVRRPTGGRGVLHDDELTYSVVAGVRDGVPRGVAASYRHLCAALAEAYRRLGVEAELTARPRGEPGAGACYLHATPADLSLGAAKLSGSAQVWREDAVLQHGSFVLSRDVAAEAEVFRLDAEGAASLDRETMTLERALSGRPSLDAIAEAVAGAFADVLGIVLEPDSFDESERTAASAAASEFRLATAPRSEVDLDPTSRSRERAGGPRR